jgi:hypothetical protein
MISPAATGTSANGRGAEPADPRYASLSPQERRILDLIADGQRGRCPLRR